MENSFDWFVGTWISKQRRPREVLAGSDEWYEFPGEHRSWNALDGICNVDEALFPTEGFGGVTLRLYDKARDEWSLYWASSRTGLLALPPVVGRFGDDGRGVFTSEELVVHSPIPQESEGKRSRCATCGRTSRPPRRGGSRSSSRLPGIPGRFTA